jgi:hypothetical protein
MYLRFVMEARVDSREELFLLEFSVVFAHGAWGESTLASMTNLRYNTTENSRRNNSSLESIPS